MLLRQWSLESAMRYSTYVSTQLKLWGEIGRKNLKHIIAQLGIPSSDAEQQY